MSTINEDDLKARLDPLSYAVLREGATERPFTGEYTDTDKVGSYRCKACGNELFTSETKFHSGCGWPSFYAPTADDAVTLIEDRSLAPRVRTEVRCANCDSHLGHVLRVRGMRCPQMSAGVSTPWPSIWKKSLSDLLLALNSHVFFIISLPELPR